MRILRGSKHLNTNTPTHWLVWLGCTSGTVLVAYILGSAIPIFSSFVGLVGATFAPFMCMIPMGFMYLKDSYWGRTERSLRDKAKAAWAAAVIVMGAFLVVAGTYAAVLDIKASTSTVKPWSCTDNSNSVPTS